MEKSHGKEKSSKRSREDRDRESTKEHRSRDRDRDGKHRSRDGDEKRSHHRSDRERSYEGRESHRDHKYKRERSYELKDVREGSREIEGSEDRIRDGNGGRSRYREVKHEDPYDEDGEFEHQRSRESYKRKERDVSEDRGDGGDKRARMSEKKERRKFEDRVKKEVDAGGIEEDVKDKSDISEVSVNKEVKNGLNGNGQSHGTADGASLTDNGASPGPDTIAPRIHHTLPPGHPLPTKVSSNFTTNENKGVSITRSHEVTGKSSTDGTSATGKSGSLSMDALAKAKRALQIQKDLSERMKKIPLLNKSAHASSDGSSHLRMKDGAKEQSSSGAVSATGSSSSFLAPAAASRKPPVSGVTAHPGLTNAPTIEAVKRAQELAARMGFRQDPEFAPLINLFPGQMTTDVVLPLKPTRAPVLRLDALGREIDEHGNVVNITKPSDLSTLKVNINKQKKDAFQILKPELDVDPESNPHFDARMGINKDKILRPKRMTFEFVEEGKWSKDAEIIKLKSQFGEAQAKELKAKQAQLAKAKAAPDINPNLIEVSERVFAKEKPKDPIPETEWWDVPLLQAGSYADIMDGVVPEDKLKMGKITIYVEHPRPIEPPAEPAPPPPQPLKLTKKEQKKLRTQRRLAREKDKQEMIRQGLLEPPKAKVKMSNLMKVLGSEATQDPTRLEMEIRSAAAEREQAHVDRNIARKLTPAERREKKERKLFDDANTMDTLVSVYKINDLSHPQTRFKVDVNARENRMTGCTVISDDLSVVVVEGGSKPIKRYGKLMLNRINWADAVKDDDDADDESERKGINKCVLVWQGSVAKPSFNRFTLHECRSAAAARKVFSDAGVAHYWDLAVNYSEDLM